MFIFTSIVTITIIIFIIISMLMFTIITAFLKLPGSRPTLGGLDPDRYMYSYTYIYIYRDI